MENLIKINSPYNSLDKLHDLLKKESHFECSKDYDIWEQRTDSNGQMKQCIVLKKNSMHAVKMFFVNEDNVKINHIIPSKIMNAYFGKSQKRYKSILEIITGKIKEVALAGTQQKAFKELEAIVRKAAS